MPSGIDEIFTIRLVPHPVNAEMRSSFVGDHIGATFELRAGVVKAEALRVERSESLATENRLKHSRYPRRNVRCR